MTLIEFLILIIVLTIAMNYWVAGEFYDIAVMKGYNERKYFWLSFLCTIAGWLMVVALPDKSSAETGEKPAKQKEAEDELPDL